MDKYRTFTNEEIEEAINIDMMSYLSNKGYQFKKNGRNRYLLEPHSSLVLFTNTNSWYSFKDNKGGNLINFLQYYENKTFQEAMLEIIGDNKNINQKEIKKYTPISKEKEELILPNANKNNNRVISYLTKSRGIDVEIVNEMINQGNIYENDKGGVVFLGKDKENNVKFACIRGTNENGKFRQDVKNSEKDYGFKTVGKSNRLFVFEAPIDLLSHATLSKMQGEDWQKDNRVSLGGTSDKALSKFLEENKNIEEIVLFLDNDDAGRENAKKIAKKYNNNYNVKIFFSVKGKDINEMLLNYNKEKELDNNVSLKEFIKEMKIYSVSNNNNEQDIKSDIIYNISERNNYMKDSLDKEIYNKIFNFGKDVLNGKEDYLELEANGFDNLVLEKIDKDEYSLAHYSILNGDAMRSPEITFKVENESIEITSYLDDYVGDYKSYEELKQNFNLELELKDFFNNWLENIVNIEFQSITKNQEYEIEKIKELYPQGTLIQLESMQDESLKSGLMGFVKNVDDIGQIHIIWQDGSNLALNINTDKFNKIDLEILPLETKLKVEKIKEKLFNFTQENKKKQENKLNNVSKHNNRRYG